MLSEGRTKKNKEEGGENKMEVILREKIKTEREKADITGWR
jgi:hypothetical protein